MVSSKTGGRLPTPKIYPGEYPGKYIVVNEADSDISQISKLDCAEPYRVNISEGNVSTNNIISSDTYMECDWTIRGYRGSHVKLEFLKFDLPPAVGKGLCREAFVMYGGYDYKGKRIIQDKICGSLIPETFYSNRGNAWLSYTVTGFFRTRFSGNDSNRTHSLGEFTIKFTISTTEHSENQLIVGLTCGLLLPTCCCIPLCIYVRKLKKKKLRELAETDKVIQREKKAELKRMLSPIKRNKWQRMSGHRKVVLKSAKCSPATQPRKRRRLSGSVSSCSQSLLPPGGKPPDTFTSGKYDDTAQYVEPEVHSLSINRKDDIGKQKSVKHKSKIKSRIRSSADSNTYLSLTELQSNVACQGSAGSCPWNVTSTSLHSSTPMPAKTLSALPKHILPRTRTDHYFSGGAIDSNNNKPSPVAGKVRAFVESDTQSSSGDGFKIKPGVPAPRVSGSQLNGRPQHSDQVAPDGNNNQRKLWIPKVIITDHGEESSSQSCSFNSYPRPEKDQVKVEIPQPSEPTPDSSTLSDSYYLDSTKEKGIIRTKPLTASQKPKLKLRVNGAQPKQRGQSIRKRPRPIKEEESTESYISTDPTDQSESDHSVQNVDWSFEDPRHLSLIKECLEETDRATSFETMIKSQENIIDNGCLRNTKTENDSTRGQSVELPRKEDFELKSGGNNTVVDHEETRVSCEPSDASSEKQQGTAAQSKRAVNTPAKRMSSSSWELTPGIFTKACKKFDFRSQRNLKQLSKRELPGITPLAETTKQKQPTSCTDLDAFILAEKAGSKQTHIERDMLTDQEWSPDEGKNGRDTEQQDMSPCASKVDSSPSVSSYRKMFRDIPNVGSDNNIESEVKFGFISSTENMFDLPPPLSPMGNIDITSSSRSQPSFPKDNDSVYMTKMPSFENTSHLENSVFTDSYLVKSSAKPVSSETFIVPTLQQNEPTCFKLSNIDLPNRLQEDNSRTLQTTNDTYIMKETAL